MDWQRKRKLSKKGSVSSKTRTNASPHPREAQRRRLQSPADCTAHITDDSELSLSKIKDNSGTSIMEMMQEIKETAKERDQASVFVRHLDCLRLIHLGRTIEFEKARINVFDEDSECAIVSWSWTPSKYERKAVGSGFIADSASERKCSEVRDSVWRRAAAYMLHERIKYLWIDAECINQDNKKEKEKAMSEMDWLYHCGTHPFGMLTRPVESEDELHLLAQILQGELPCQSAHKREFPLKKGIATPSARDAIRLLDEITSDIWWKRAWIYQENYHGGARMHLLMPHTSKLNSLKAKYGDLFGDLEGDLIIPSIQFSEALTEICSGFITWSAPDDPEQEVAQRILSRAARYSLLLEDRNSMSPTVIADVVNRCVTNHPDRLHIIANCCSYNKHLNSNKLQNKGSSISLAILVLFLLNGEVFHSNLDEKRRNTMASESSNLTVVEFIRRYAFDRFSPPFPGYELTFNKSCRFVDVSLEADGVHTKGHLWKLCDKAIGIPRRELKNLDTIKTLWALQQYIEGLPLKDEIACRLREFLMDFKEPESLAEEYMQTMAETVADALQHGRSLILAYLCNSLRNPRWSPPMGIFICPDEAMDSNGSFVFTSFRASKKTSDGPAYNGDVDKHVSLQVDVGRDQGLPPKLFARAWMHGLCFLTEEMQSVVFPLPRILNEL